MAVQTTNFTQDVLGRYICNQANEALLSMNPNGRRADGSPQNDARSFNVIVVGGGSFGLAMAQHLFFSDRTHSYRVLILEAGGLVLTEHVQNLPMLGLNVPGPTETDPFVPRNEVWGLPWRSAVQFGFTGLAYLIGGRSVFFGGWSPQLLDTPKYTEMPRNLWPDQELVKPLNERYFVEAADQIGTDKSNDFVDGPMHQALREQLFMGINDGRVTDAIPLNDLPLHLKGFQNRALAIKNLHKLEAPLAVQSKTESGLFPINKFSSVPLLIKAARTATVDSMQGMPYADDVKKRLMIVPLCRVIKLVSDVKDGTGTVTEIETEVQTDFCGPGGPQKTRIRFPVSPEAKVVIALGTIESTRMALLSFEGIRNYNQIGKNMLAHLRSNLTIRVLRESIATLDPKETALQASALFVKGRHQFADGTIRYFHHQITAAGLDRPSTDSEAELFKKIPDIDTFYAMRRANDDRIVITIRGIGEMEPHNPDSGVDLAAETDEVGIRRAFVRLSPTDKDNQLWDALDKSADDVAKVFANGKRFQVLNSHDQWVNVNPGDDLRASIPYTFRAAGGRRDGLGTTHHEAGPLCMGMNPDTSVTNPDGRFHFVSNAYAVGPATFPSLGSPNPMLTGVALARRLADHLLVPPFAADPNFTMLFDGSNTDRWRMSTITNQASDKSYPGTFLLIDRTLESLPGNDLGLFWNIDPAPNNFILKLEWLRWREDDNSGVFFRFPDPNGKGYNNTAYVAINFGFEIQIDQLAREDGAAIHMTGAIYGLAGPSIPNALPVRAPSEWNEFEIHVLGQRYTVFLNGEKITDYTNPDPNRGSTSTPTFIGLQTHTGRVAFRKIQIKAL